MEIIPQNAVQSIVSTLSSSDGLRTHLPTILPLSFPTPLHTLNTLTTIHLIHAILSHPRHSEYFAESNADPIDMALSAVLGLYLSSTEDWSATNLLSAAAWKSGKLDESLISEMFRIETTREREHETMKAIRVGGRWAPGAELVEELKGWFLGFGGELKCAGEWVSGVVEESWKEGDDVKAFVKHCCDWSIAACPPLKDVYDTSSETDILPSAPLHLIHDLSVRQATSHDLQLRLPHPSELVDLSPLPLSIPAVLVAGVVLPPAELELSDAVHAYKTSEGTQRVELSLSAYTHIAQKTVEVSRVIRQAVGQSVASYFDIHSHFKKQEETAKKQGRQLVLVVKF